MKKTKLEKGITLIALIITIIILLILAVITIRSIKKDGIISYAQDAATNYEKSQEEEQIALGYSEYKINSITNPDADLKVQGATVSGDKINGWTVTFESGNPYQVAPDGNISIYESIVNPNPTDWTIAYAYDGTTWTKYTEDDQAIGGNAEGGKVEGQIVAKFYKQDIPIAEESLDIDKGNELEGEQIIRIPAKDYSYKLYIEGSGTGEMPAMFDGEELDFGYQTGIAEAIKTLDAENILIPYVTDVVICEGVKNIGAFALAAGININNIQIARTVETIDAYAFVYCEIQNLMIPNSVKSIGEGAFSETILNDVTIPEGIETIGKYAFHRSTLTRLTIPTTVRKVENGAFASCSLLKEVYIYTLDCDFAAYCFSNMYDSRNDDIEPKAKIYVKDKTFADMIGTPGGDYEFVEF